MPRIDPLQLLNCLNVLLTPKGGIKSEQEVARISSLMEKFSKKLVSKCVYLLILKSSDIHLLSKFMGLGGWNLIYNWLLHAVEAKNYPFLIELLEVIIICPVDIERLKSNPMPRQIKFLSKDTTVDLRVRDLASDIVKHWLAIVKGTPVPPTPVNNTSPKTGINTETRTQQALESVKLVPTAENVITEQRVLSDGSNEEVDDANYVKSTSPSSSSAESDESDVFVPCKKAPVKNKKVTANEKLSTKRPNQEEKPKLKSKLIQNADSKDSKKAAIKLRIEKKVDNSPELKSKKEEKTLEQKIKEKRKLKEEKDKEKFARYKHEREKKEKLGKERRLSATDNKNGKEKSQDDKLKGELSKLIPRSLDKLGRIPKKPKEPDTTAEDKQSQQRKEDAKEKPKVEEKKSVKKDDKSISSKSKDNEKEARKDKEKDSKKTVPAPPKKPVSMSVEKRFATEAKPKTVKAYNSKFRLTGLEQEATSKPPARKSSSSSGNSSSSSSKDKNAVKRSPTKDAESEPVEKKQKSPDVSITEDKSSPVPVKVKKPFLQESDVFMNAMNVALETQKESLRKRKKPTQKADSETKAEESPSRKSADAAVSPIAKTEKDVKPSFKFYKDTLDLVNDENNSENAAEEVDVKPSLYVPDSNNEAEEDYQDIKIKMEPGQPRSADGLKSSLSIFRVKKHPKKSVRWRRDDELEAIQYFEVDATERTNVVRTFWDMQMMERSKERESLLQARKNAENDKMAVQTKWKPLIPIDVPPSTTMRGANSQEKNIQYARERTVPPAIYFNKSMIPDTPTEPDLEIHPVTVPPTIPLDDISGSQDSVNDFSTYRWPEPKQFPADNGEMNMMNAGFMANAGVPPPMFPPFPDGTFPPPPFGQPFFPGGPVGPLPVPPSNWTPGNSDQNQQNQNSMPMNWPPPNVVPPPVGPPGMIGPPPFGMMAPPFPPIPGPGFPGAPNMFPPANVNQQQMPSSSPSSDNQQYSNSTYSNNSESNKKWNNDDRYYRKDGWKNNYSDRGRDKRGSSSWRGSGSNSKLCRIFQKKGYCNVNGCRFYHPEK